MMTTVLLGEPGTQLRPHPSWSHRPVPAHPPPLLPTHLAGPLQPGPHCSQGHYQVALKACDSALTHTHRTPTAPAPLLPPAPAPATAQFPGALITWPQGQLEAPGEPAGGKSSAPAGNLALSPGTPGAPGLPLSHSGAGLPPVATHPLFPGALRDREPSRLQLGRERPLPRPERSGSPGSPAGALGTAPTQRPGAPMPWAHQAHHPQRAACHSPHLQGAHASTGERQGTPAGRNRTPWKVATWWGAADNSSSWD